MNYPAIFSAQALLQICKAKGLKHIVISPGSRNAPLTLGFNLDPYFTTYSIVDERCAAFFAVGIAQQIDSYVAVVCTSGSALLNYYPAVAEAFYQQIPLVVISADRPASKIDIGDGQTIRQANVFSNHVHGSANLTEKDTVENHLKIQETLALALRMKGPVHINIPFEEPLYGLSDELQTLVEIIDETTEEIIVEISERYKNIWQKATKKLVLIGELKPNTLSQSTIDLLANDSSVVVMTETTSNVYAGRFLNKIDVVITPFSEIEFSKFQPELLISVGGMLVSKRIKSFLRKYQPTSHWHIDSNRAYDTFGCLSHHFKCDANLFFDTMSKVESPISDYQQQLLVIKARRTLVHNQFLEKVVFSDLKVFDTILKAVPAAMLLQISNSSSIRYAQLFDLKPNQSVFCNRGTSGIDGSTSTAIGAAVGAQRETLLITGDLSFFYDSNALWNSKIPHNFKIIVINNNGGGIFRILPGHEENDVFSTFFETTHQLTAMQLASMYDFKYLTADNESSLTQTLQDLFLSKEKTILEVFTPKNTNDKVLKAYFKNF
jgi:2-succinyl-5-enolpyruvyl-6-hydroxy-3-cyclohexene-1-carboxylate synthase